jgi:hypothetical protein
VSTSSNNDLTRVTLNLRYTVMANLTLTIDDELLKRARIRALERGTSVNALVRDYIEHFADEDAAREAIVGLFEIAERSRAGSGPEGRTWTREEIQRYR